MTDLMRDRLVSWLKRDLLGPGSDDECLKARPERRYLLGTLHPAFTRQAKIEQDEAIQAIDRDDPADVAATYGGMRQSAIGISFITEPGSPVTADVRFAEYERIGGDDSDDGDDDEETAEGDGEGLRAGSESWGDARVAAGGLREGGTPTPALTDGGGERGEPGAAIAGLREGWCRRSVVQSVVLTPDRQASISKDIQLEWRSRPHDGLVLWTVSLVNRRRGRRARPIFQPEIRISVDGDAGLIARQAPARSNDPDEELSRLLYRRWPEFAVGHGCAAEWADEPNAIRWARTSILPVYEVPSIIPREDSACELGMDVLSNAKDPTSLARSLEPLESEYRCWIEGQRKLAKELPDSVRETALGNIRKCEAAADRMRAGIQAVRDLPQAFDAFRFMNRAMFLQRKRTLEAAHYRRTGQRVPANEASSWRPFQLGFILVNIPGLVDATSPDRQLVDLLWFPTGGGKTEAYLGLSAFTIAYRRCIEPPDEAFVQGVDVLMRYTLRLLTTQQFERAAALIAACESLRRKKPKKWGGVPMTIGVWLGEDATPNSYDRAVDERSKLAGDSKASEKHHFVLRHCPWCGERLIFPDCFRFDDEQRSLSIVCTHGGCEFSKAPGLPVNVIDESVYLRPPSMLIATVDKFARLPWVAETASLFGRAARLCSSHGFVVDVESHRMRFGKGCAIGPASRDRGISLIIQDELHLISGPLGTLVGLYEIAIEYLAGREGQPPKIIASTATIHSAIDQIRGLYGRRAALFPTPPIDAFESFFAKIADASKRPGRLFVGLTAPGTSMKTALVRTYASLLSGAKSQGASEAECDPYWTLVGYFNSLRELGGAVSLMQDDVPSRIESMKKAEGRPDRGELRFEELTSRIFSYDIPNRLKQMEQGIGTGLALDAILATNMISVGIDIDRLGLMVVAGQPKGTAEYIQATSRVGRQHPGLIVTVYNWSRPRDISHYERFVSYHSTLYRHVEATSVTPLSPRARDRAVHAVGVAAMRLADPTLAENRAASSATRIPTSVVAKEFMRFFERRTEDAAEEQGEATAALNELRGLMDEWIRRATASSDLTYQRQKGSPNNLLRQASSEAELALTDFDPRAWPTLNSLRNVEGEHRWFET